MTLAKHLDVEVLSQLESRSKIIVDLLGGKDIQQSSFQAPRPVSFSAGGDRDSDGSQSLKLFRLSDATGAISFDLVKDGQHISPSDLDGNDVFLCDTGSRLWVWQGSQASKREKALWLKVAQSYIRQIQEERANSAAHLIPISNVVQGHESPAFWKAITV
jgi:gelsolin